MSQTDVLLDLVSPGAIYRMEAILQAGVTAATVQRAVAAGMIERVSRGVYCKAGCRPADEGRFAEAVIRIPKGLVCLLSAAGLHGLGDPPDAIWVALPHNLSTPRVEWPAIKYVRYRNRAAFEVGTEIRNIAGVDVRFTGPARTVVDMLRMTGAVGEDAALRCLREYHRRGLPVGDVEDIAGELGWTSRILPILKVSRAMLQSP